LAISNQHIMAQKACARPPARQQTTRRRSRGRIGIANWQFGIGIAKDCKDDEKNHYFLPSMVAALFIASSHLLLKSTKHLQFIETS